MASFLNKMLAWLRSKICPACSCQTPKPNPVAPPTDFFNEALAYVFPNEGGFSNDPDDHGGATNYGITQKELSAWLGREASLDEVLNISLDTVRAIYRKNYWTDVGLDQIKVKAIALAVFDQGVLDGPQTAIRLAQLAANNCGANLDVDGQIGPFTCKAFEYVKLSLFMDSFVGLLSDRFHGIVAGNQTQAKFLGGWLKRANRLRTLVG